MQHKTNELHDGNSDHKIFSKITVDYYHFEKKKQDSNKKT